VTDHRDWAANKKSDLVVLTTLEANGIVAAAGLTMTFRCSIVVPGFGSDLTARRARQAADVSLVDVTYVKLITSDSINQSLATRAGQVIVAAVDARTFTVPVENGTAIAAQLADPVTTTTTPSVVTDNSSSNDAFASLKLWQVVVIACAILLCCCLIVILAFCCYQRDREVTDPRRHSASPHYDADIGSTKRNWTQISGELFDPEGFDPALNMARRNHYHPPSISPSSPYGGEPYVGDLQGSYLDLGDQFTPGTPWELGGPVSPAMSPSPSHVGGLSSAGLFTPAYKAPDPDYDQGAVGTIINSMWGGRPPPPQRHGGFGMATEYVDPAPYPYYGSAQPGPSHYYPVHGQGSMVNVNVSPQQGVAVDRSRIAHF
jgi:hypothetical protein